jgi:hypothetical protein
VRNLDINKLFDETVEDFMNARQRRNGKLDHQIPNSYHKFIMDATSFDILRQPNYYERFNYTIPAERKPSRSYDHCDAVRRVLDFPYYNGQDYIDNLFTYREGPASIRKFSEVGRVPTIRPKNDYR